MFQRPPIRKNVPVSSGIVGAAGVIAFIALMIALLGTGTIKVGGGSDPGSGGGKLPSVSIEGSIPCQASDYTHLTSDRLHTCVDAKKYAKAKLVQMGQSGQWGCLDKLWDHESNWSAWAVGSPTSNGRAQGIPQALGHGDVFSLGDWKAQVDWGLNYIFHGSGNFSNPCDAWTFWNSHTPHWY